jgi:bifunctional non-homologous end joining protein LigD
MGLDEYRRKRDFERTGEPRGRRAQAREQEEKLQFVVQKHAARSLHYDFRLELDGVLKSWAVPKGPSLVPTERRMAAQTEDHPIEYGGFEGVIPRGEYGAGSVVVWDRGWWEPIGDPRAGLAKGDLSFQLEGEKLRGRWHLVRMRPRQGERRKPSWLLIKGRDQEARDASSPPITESAPRSVISGRDVGDVARDADRVWSSVEGEIEPPADAVRVERPEKPETSAAAVREVAGVRLSHPDRVYFPELGITKRELAQYYERMAERVLPGLVNRPLSLLRCPERYTECFYQKRANRSIPAIVPRVVVRGGREAYAMVKDLASLIALVQVGVLEFHVWGARADRLDRPDLLIFDLDPDPAVPWSQLAGTAQLLRGVLEELGLVPFVRSSGGKGLHLVTPIERRSEWDEVKGFAEDVALLLVRAAPDRYTAEVAKAKRRGRIYIDYLRNDREATAIATWSVRARPGAPVAATLHWDELESAKRPVIGMRDAGARLERADPWAEFEASRRALTATMRRRVRGR